MKDHEETDRDRDYFNQSLKNIHQCMCTIRNVKDNLRTLSGDMLPMLPKDRQKNGCVLLNIPHTICKMKFKS